jgi:hypothetical protein
MILIEKIVERIGSFSPMIIFVLLCISYLGCFENQTSDPEQIRKEVKQVDKKLQTDNETQSYWLFRD